MTARRRDSARERDRKRLMDEAWNIIGAAMAKENFAVASATLERAARIAGLWSEKAAPIEEADHPATQVFTSEPMTAEQWSEKFVPRDG